MARIRGSFSPFGRPKGIDLIDDRRNREIIERSRRGNGPFQRSPIPRISRRIGALLPIFDAIENIVELEDDAEKDQNGPDEHQLKQRAPT